MRAMEYRTHPIQRHPHPRPLAFTHLAAAREEERLNVAPEYPGAYRIGEDSFKVAR
jgi:hypothetical protein